MSLKKIRMHTVCGWSIKVIDTLQVVGAETVRTAICFESLGLSTELSVQGENF